MSLGLLVFFLRFRNNFFLQCEVVSLTINPQTEGSGYPFSSMVITLDVSSMAGPNSNIRYLQHGSRDHTTTQATPMSQSRVTFGGILLQRATKILRLCAFHYKFCITELPGTTTRKLNLVK